jgi:hypothetical protein
MELAFGDEAISFATPADVLANGILDDGIKRVILRQWQRIAVTRVDPCRDAITAPLLAELGRALETLAQRR